MLDTMRKLFTAILIACIFAGNASAQTKLGDVATIDRTVYDFGDIQMSQGPVSCSFKVTNTSRKDITIMNVVSSCGCTDVSWSRESIKPGASGTISATYKNDEGPYPFDKTLTAYITEAKQPVILHLRGVVLEKKLPLGETYPVHFGALGMRSAEIKAGNVLQGQQKSGEMKIANLSSSPARITFNNVSDGLAIKLDQNPVPAGQTTTLTYTITTDRDHWGKNWYYATPVINGKSYAAEIIKQKETKPERGAEAIVSEPNPEIGAGKNRIGFYAFTKEDFSALSKEQRSAGPNPMFTSSTFTFNQVKAGTKVEVAFDCKNIGKDVLKVYKADSDSRRVVVEDIKDIRSGGSGKIKAVLDTKGLPSGEVLFIVTLTTNSPLRPMVNLYINGYIK